MLERVVDGALIIGNFRDLKIDETVIRCDTDAFVIAEIGHNHQGDIQICKEMFDAAKWAGCNAVKLQKRENRTLYTEEMYNSPYNSENAFGATYGAHREALEFDWEQYCTLQEYAHKLGLTFFATAFDIPSAEFLAELGTPAVKIASGDLTNKPLLEWMEAGPNWVIILSTGGGTEETVKAAFNICQPECVMQCTSSYPAAYNELDLRVVRTYTKWFPDTTIGYSGHDTGILAPCIAYSWGARIIEKHFTLNRAMKGTDQAFSLEPQGMRAMIENLKHTREAIGDGKKRRYESEAEPLKKQLKNAQGQIDGATVW